VRIPSFAAQISSMVRPILMGRIDVMSMGYTFGSQGYTNPQGVHLKAFEDDLGRYVSLIRKKSVSCPDPERRDGALPVVRNRASVPFSQCLKCAHRLPKGCCALLRADARESLKRMNDAPAEGAPTKSEEVSK